MKKFLFLFVLGFFALSFSSVAHAQEKSKEQDLNLKSDTQGTTLLNAKSSPASSAFDAREMLIRSKDQSFPYVYVVRDGVKSHVKSIEELRAKFAGKPILNVSEETLQKYNGTIIDGKAYKEGNLVKDIKNKIYAVGDNILNKVQSLSDLATYFFGKKITKVDTVIEKDDSLNVKESQTNSTTPVK